MKATATYHEIIPEKKTCRRGCRYNDERLRTGAIRAKAPFTSATLD